MAQRPLISFSSSSSNSESLKFSFRSNEISVETISNTWLHIYVNIFIRFSPLQAALYSLLSFNKKFSNLFCRLVAASWIVCCRDSGPISFANISSMSSCFIRILRDSSIRMNSISGGVKKIIAVPEVPARAVRPIRWT